MKCFRIDPICLNLQSLNGLVAQLDRAPDYGSGGWGFDSSLVHTENEAVTQLKCSCFFVFTNNFTNIELCHLLWPSTPPGPRSAGNGADLRPVLPEIIKKNPQRKPGEQGLFKITVIPYYYFKKSITIVFVRDGFQKYTQ